MLNQIPLQIYLNLLLMSYASSSNALQILKRGSLNLNPCLQERAEEIKERLRGKSQQELKRELEKQVSNRFSKLLSVISSLNQYKYQRTLKEMPVIWQDGSTGLLDYGSDLPEDAPKVIFVPSLINRSYILDLSEKRSFLRYLRGKNIHPYLIDWNDPDESELDFSISDYIEKRINPVIDHIAKKSGGKIFLAGYCMGGLMAIASAMTHQDKLAGLAMLATPYDFHVEEFARVEIDDTSIKILENIIDSSEKISASIIQSVFYYLHVDAVRQKFDLLFNRLGDENEDIEEFIAMEYWVNDGIAMTRNVAKECFIDWVHYNSVCKGNWKTNPEKIKLPTFFAVAENDHIVPKASTLPLINLISDRKVVTAGSGHISLVAGSRAKDEMWQHFADWIKKYNGVTV